MGSALQYAILLLALPLLYNGGQHCGARFKTGVCFLVTSMAVVCVYTLYVFLRQSLIIPGWPQTQLGSRRFP